MRGSPPVPWAGSARCVLLKVWKGEFLTLLQDFTLLLISYGNAQILALVLALVQDL